MTAILPPSERLWWKHPMDRQETLWIAIAFVWCMIMFAMMVGWHFFGKQNLSTETYKVDPAKYAERAEAFVAKYTVRKETDQEIPVVSAPEGSDVYMIGRLWNWWPILELEKGKTYKLHLTSMDYNHGFSLQPINMNIQVVPGYEHVIKITPNQSGQYSIVCNEYCGIGHHEMVGRLYVK
ncbi:MAG: cytochrome C oxidase subunit II [Comamonas sp. SCN 67-35]|uniref:cytochrome C oxidase subunit II n=1 Tax=unclassified Comamonas TaxID=2638500 RepID=UPI00086E99C8|nr:MULTISPECIES: cytochrome C oxidase subunit II [unclassified Comamonas]MBN9329591.1 cytochrome C oxidase subunit II [Comamonas sp.]ODU37806.1 MAG: cytochrome C oxidase subunit II [Comamonas sp. SCN 67-35]OJX03008.1 MAG: cytochrome C oxidase subunit II [Burkholderiales bacterium 66-26]